MWKIDDEASQRHWCTKEDSNVEERGSNRGRLHSGFNAAVLEVYMHAAGGWSFSFFDSLETGQVVIIL